MVFNKNCWLLGERGVPLDSLTEGSIVMIPENGTLTPFYLAKRNYESGLNGAGRVLFVRKKSKATRQWHSDNVNAYSTSTINTWLNGTYKKQFDSKLQEAMGTTKFYYSIGNGNYNKTTLERSVFLLSCTEAGGNVDLLCNVEGTKLPTNVINALASQHSSTNYWTRSATVNESGDGKTECAISIGWHSTLSAITTTSDRCLVSNAVHPCFTLPSTMCVSLEPNTDGSFNLIV